MGRSRPPFSPLPSVAAQETQKAGLTPAMATSHTDSPGPHIWGHQTFHDIDRNPAWYEPNSGKQHPEYRIAMGKGFLPEAIMGDAARFERRR